MLAHGGSKSICRTPDGQPLLQGLAISFLVAGMTPGHCLVRKGQLRRTELRERPEPSFAAGRVCVATDRFALTSNNMTDAAPGDAMKHWFF